MFLINMSEKMCNFAPKINHHGENKHRNLRIRRGDEL